LEVLNAEGRNPVECLDNLRAVEALLLAEVDLEPLIARGTVQG
jgi:hypothetical protein